MEKRYIIVRHDKDKLQYFQNPVKDTQLFESYIWKDSLWMATYFTKESDAEKQIAMGYKNYNWGGIFQIETLFVCQ